MPNPLSKHIIFYRIPCSSKDDALNACHRKEYETGFWNYVNGLKDKLETEVRPSISQSQRIIVENVDSRTVFLRGEHCAEFRATLNLEDLFASQFP